MLSEQVKITTALDYATGTADRNGATLDMQGWDGVLMLVHFATIAAGGTNSIKAQQGAASNLSDAADLEGTGQSVAADDDNEIYAIDLYQPRERYVRLVVDKDTSNACAESAVYIQYKGKELPSTHASGVTVETHVSPAEGTA
jgi:hypothetical protein